MSNGHANHTILNSLLRIQAERLMSEKPNKDGPVTNHTILNSLLRIQAERLMSEKPNKDRPVTSKCSMHQTNITEGTGNQTETEKQGSVLK